MANGGIFLGGMAQGMESAEQSRRADEELGLRREGLGLKREGLGLRERALDIQERGLQQESDMAQQERIDTTLSDSLTKISEVNTALAEAGVPLEDRKKRLMPVIDDHLQTVQAAGRDATRAARNIELSLQAAQTPGEVAATEGRSSAQKRVSEARALQDQGIPEGAARATAGIETTQGKLPDVINMMSPNGEDIVAVDRTSPDAGTRIRGLAKEGYFRVSTGIQSAGREGLGPPEVPGGTIGDVIDAQASARNVVSEIGRLRQQVEEDTITGLFTGTVIRGLSNVAGEMRQFAAASGFDDSALLDPAEYDLSSFGPDAASSAAFRSNAMNLAYLLARAAEPGGRLSEPDIQRQIDRISANAGDQGQLLASLGEIERATKVGYQNFHTSASQFVENLPDIPKELESAEGEETTEGQATQDQQTQDMNAASHSTGTRARTADGQVYEVRDVNGVKRWVLVEGE